MATKKQLEQMAKFAETAAKNDAERKAAQVANGHGAKNKGDQDFAQEFLERSKGSKKRADKARENEIVSAGGKPKSKIRRFLGT